VCGMEICSFWGMRGKLFHKLELSEFLSCTDCDDSCKLLVQDMRLDVESRS